MKTLKVSEFKKLTGLKNDRIYRWIKEGRIKAVKKQGKLQIIFNQEKWLSDNLLRSKKRKELIKVLRGLQNTTKFLEKFITEDMLTEQILNEKLNKK